MKIAHLTAGTGSFHCGNCHRDASLVHALRAQGHDAFLVPLYLPLVLDDPATAPSTPVFAGGINMFLQQKLPFFRHTPRWLDRLFDATGLLRTVSAWASLTRARDLGEMTVEAFRGLDGRQGKEWQRLLDWLITEKPDIIAFSNGLLTGLAQGVKEQLGCRTVATLQGEDSFLDTLPEPFKTEAWSRMSRCSQWIDHYAAVSDYYRDVMTSRMALAPGKIVTVANGIDLNAYAPAAVPPAVPTLGFLARMCHGKGLHTLIAAFLLLRSRGHVPGVRLRIAGSVMAADHAYLRPLKTQLSAAGAAGDVDWLPNLPGEEKTAFLQSLSVLSVPALYGEAFGLYLIEALACGVPVVQPDHAAFPEIIHATGGGVLFPVTAAPADSAADVGALVVALEQLLLTPGLAPQIGQRGAAAVARDFSAAAMARRFTALLD
jgi:glycosyltransferase involved in cell wall biosynthesis